MNKMNRRIFNFFLLVMFFGIASSVSATTYRLQRVTSVENGGKYVFEQAGYVMINSASDNSLQTTDEFSTTGLTGLEDYIWSLSKISKTDTYKMLNEKAGSNKYLYNNSSTNLKFDSNATEWSFSFQSDGTAFISTGNGSSMRTLGYSSPSLDDYNYKCYTLGDLGYQPHSIVVYKLVPETEGKSSPALSFSYKFSKLIKDETFTAPTFSHAGSFNGTVTYSSSNEGVAKVNESTGAVSIVGSGHALITASSEADGTYDAGEATYTIVVMDGDGTSSKPFSVADFYSGFLGSNNATVWATGYIVGGYKSGEPIYTYQESATSDKYFSLADATENINSSNVVPVEYASFGLYSHPELKNCKVLLYGKIGYIFNKTSLNNVSSASKLAYGVTISNYKYATYRTTEKLDFTDTGVSAYTAAIDGNNVKLTKISDGVVDTGLGVVLYSGTAGTYDIPVTTANATVANTGLSISDGTSATKENMTYVLGKKKDGDGNDVVGFYRWISAESLPAGRVYLDGSTSAARDYLEFMFDEPTGIGNVNDNDNDNVNDSDNHYYDLQGRRVAHGQQPATKGLYIVNGKKIVIK